MFGSRRPQSSSRVTQMKITALGEDWHDLMLGVDEVRLNHFFPWATVRCIITDYEVEADLMT